ncbi:MAG: alkaline phosphatase family protein [Actinomycetota bacterium]
MDDHDRPHPGALSRRAFLKGAAAVPLAAYLAACTTSRPTVRVSASAVARPAPTPTPPAVLPAEAKRIARLVPKEVLERVYQGFIPGMSGEVVTVPIGFNYFDGGISHSTPWPYTQHVPMVWYGPGIVPSRGSIHRPVTSADQAPTLAKITGFSDFQAPDGTLMEEVIDPKAPKPKLIVTLVWDAGGMYVLGLWPDNWPNLKALMRNGVSYANATVGSSPSSTAPVHATMGTGAFPRRHGILDNLQKDSAGRIVDPWTPGPRAMLLPGFADFYGAELGDKVEVGLFATLSWHLGMMGMGTAFDGGKRQLAILREKGGGEGAEGISWGMSDRQAPYYRFPDYVNDLPAINTYWPMADAFDGVSDGKWRGHAFEDLRLGFDTPARVPYQTTAIQEVMRREGLGHHEGTDLMFINYKLIDEVGHIFTASSQEMGDCVLAQDAGLPGFIDFLDRQVGKGKWVLLVTADHGHSANHDVSGGFPIKVPAVEGYLKNALPTKDKGHVVEKSRPGWSFVDLAEMDGAGYDLERISSDLRGMTKLDATEKPDELSTSERGDKVLLTSFPGVWLPGMIELAHNS